MSLRPRPPRNVSRTAATKGPVVRHSACSCDRHELHCRVWKCPRRAAGRLTRRSRCFGSGWPCTLETEPRDLPSTPPPPPPPPRRDLSWPRGRCVWGSRPHRPLSRPSAPHPQRMGGGAEANQTGCERLVRARSSGGAFAPIPHSSRKLASNWEHMCRQFSVVEPSMARFRTSRFGRARPSAPAVFLPSRRRSERETPSAADRPGPGGRRWRILLELVDDLEVHYRSP